MKKFLPLISIIFLIAMIGAEFASHMYDPVRSDEAAWVFSTVYYDHYFRGNWKHADWKALDAKDHPPLAKYYYGFAMDIVGSPWKNMTEKDRWLAESADFSDSKKFDEWINSSVPISGLIACRAANALSAVLAGLALFLLTYWLSNASAASLSLVIFSISRLVLYFVPIVEPDFLLMAVTLFQAAFLVKWMKTGKAWPAVISGLLLGLVLTTKMNGLLQAAVLATAFLFMMFLSARKKTAALFIVQLAIAALVAFVLNPALFDTPLAVIASSLEHRLIQFEGVRHFSGMMLISPVFPILKGVQLLFSEFGLLLDTYVFPIGIMLLVAGFVATLFRLEKIELKKLFTVIVVALMSTLWISSSVWTFSQTVRLRYLLPALPFFSMLMGYGLWSIMSVNGFKSGKKNVTAMVLAAVLFVVAWVGIMRLDLDLILLAAQKNVNVEIERQKFTLVRHPADPSPHIHLAVFYVEKADYKSADVEMKEAMRLGATGPLEIAFEKVMADMALAR